MPRWNPKFSKFLGFNADSIVKMWKPEISLFKAALIYEKSYYCAMHSLTKLYGIFIVKFFLSLVLHRYFLGKLRI